jgi:hypothetical protein
MILESFMLIPPVVSENIPGQKKYRRRRKRRRARHLKKRLPSTTTPDRWMKPSCKMNM